MLISIVIPSKNGMAHLSDCLPSVITAADSYSAEIEIIVVDDHSTDDTLKLAEAFPSVKFLANQNTPGAGSARNYGVKNSSGKYILFIDNDVFLNKDFFPQLLKCAPEEFFAVTCAGFYFKNDKQLDGVKTLVWKRGFMRFSGNILNEHLPQSTCLRSFGVQGAYFLCDRKKFDELGGFDPLFDPYLLEESDLMYRGLKRGWQIYYARETHPMHKWGGTIASKRNKNTLFLSKKNRIIFVWKNIHDNKMLAGHLFWLLIRPQIKPLIACLKQFKAILKARQAEKAAVTVTDAALLHECKNIVKEYSQHHAE